MCYLVVVSGCEKEDAPEGPTQRRLREAREKNKCKTGMKDNTKVCCLFLIPLIYTSLSDLQIHRLIGYHYFTGKGVYSLCT